MPFHACGRRGDSGPVSLLLPTAHGRVDADLARAARHTIAVLATPALLVLEEVHLRLGIGYTAMGTTTDAERPTQRWIGFMRWQFRFDHRGADGCLIDDLGAGAPGWAPPSRRVRGLLARVDDGQGRALCQLLNYAGLFLFAEQTRLRDLVDLAAAVHHRKPRPFELVPAEANHRLLEVTSIGHTLLNHATPHKLDHLLPRRHGLREHWCRP